MATFKQQSNVNSSFIGAVHWWSPTSGPAPDPRGRQGDLGVAMNGAVYWYAIANDPNIYERFLKAPSKGKFYNSAVKAKYDYYRKG